MERSILFIKGVFRRMSKVLKKYAKGNLDADLKVISLGLGVQSTAVYLMSSMGTNCQEQIMLYLQIQEENIKKL